MGKRKSIIALLSVLFIILVSAITVRAETRYTVTFVDGFTGSQKVISKQSIIKNRPATAPKESKLPAHEGFSFYRWDKSFSKVTGNLTVKAVWRQTKSIIFYMDNFSNTNSTVVLNGRKIALKGKVVKKVYVNKDAAVPKEPAGPAHTGYTFQRWKNTEIGLKAGTVLNKVKLYATTATYRPSTYTVKYEANGGTGTMPNQTAKGSFFTLAENKFEKKGKKLSYWQCVETGETFPDRGTVKTELVIKEAASNIRKTVTMKAIWKTDTSYYRINYNVDGGQMPTTYYRKQYSPSNPDFTLPQPTKSGYVFLGWKGTELTKTTLDVTIPYGSRGERTYTAQWGKENWIFVGDSYTICAGSPYLPDLIASDLDIKGRGGKYKNIGKGGYGLAKTRSGQYGNFLELLEDTPSDSTVTHIVIIGGITNDRNRGYSDVQIAASNFVKIAQRKFPSARLYYAIGNWHAEWPDKTDQESRDQVAWHYNIVTDRMSWYKDACKANDITFLSGPEYALRGTGNDVYFGVDGQHPNLAGKEKLASAIAEALQKVGAV